MNYEKKIREYLNSDEVDQLYKSMLINLFPELAESEDEKIRKWLSDELHLLYHQAAGDKVREENFIKTISWLEKQGKPKPAWSEKDNETLEWLCRFLEKFGNEFYGGNEVNVISWLRTFKNRCVPQSKQESLRPQSHWKPNEIEITTLEDVFSGKLNPLEYSTTLQNILKQLKEL